MSLIQKLKKDKDVQEFLYAKDVDFETNFINTGSVAMNLLMSGRIDGGIPMYKVAMHASSSAEGKSFFAMKLLKNAQKKGLDCIYIDTEFAFDDTFAKSVGVDTNNILVYQNNHIEDLQEFVMKTFKGLTKPEKRNIFIVIDSWNGMVTSKTVGDAESGKDVMDMTISKKKNTFARLLTGLHCTVHVVNQVYDCLTGDTMVKTSYGDKKISEITIGEKVITPYGIEEVQNTFKYDEAPVYIVEMEDGTTIECTDAHKFLTHDECNPGELRWVEAGKLIPGAELIMEGTTLPLP